jgi:uncharacterized protein
MLRPSSVPQFRTERAVPAAVGLGLKHEHALDIFKGAPGVGFFEIHAENYMGAGGAPLAFLSAIRDRYPLSLHGVGLSIGGLARLDRRHLERLQHIVSLYRPGLFSEHLAWSSHNGDFLNDLLPLPYSEATLARVSSHVDQVQRVLGVRMLLENPSTYLAFEGSEMTETEFLAEVVARTGCGLLLDVNNVYVSAVNNRFDPHDYLDRFPVSAVGEVHLGGFASERDDDGSPLLIDSHSASVDDAVWDLFEHAIDLTGPVPTLIEWDNDVPDFAILLAEAERANAALEGSRHIALQQAA